MTQRMDMVVPRKGNDGKTRWTKIGVAFAAKNGPGWNLVFDALPIPDSEGRVVASLFEPKPRDDQPQQQRGGYSERDEVDQDGIPF